MLFKEIIAFYSDKTHKYTVGKLKSLWVLKQHVIVL
jgi:hypothetical protein